MKNPILAYLAGVPSALALMSTQALAEVPEAVATELATAKSDAVEIATLAIVIIVAIAAFMYMRKAIK